VLFTRFNAQKRLPSQDRTIEVELSRFRTRSLAKPPQFVRGPTTLALGAIGKLPDSPTSTLTPGSGFQPTAAATIQTVSLSCLDDEAIPLPRFELRAADSAAIAQNPDRYQRFGLLTQLEEVTQSDCLDHLLCVGPRGVRDGRSVEPFLLDPVAEAEEAPCGFQVVEGQLAEVRLLIVHELHALVQRPVWEELQGADMPEALLSSFVLRFV
jgi:hypothetical protein